LKGRVLAAAAEGMETGPAPRLWDRLYESRQLRAAWGVSVVALAAAHLVLSLIPGSERPESGAVAERSQTEQLYEILGVPTVEISPNAERLSMGAPSTPDRHPAPPETNDNEVKS